MQRRDVAIIFWSIAGLFSIIRGAMGLAAVFYLEAHFVGGSVMAPSAPYRLLLAATSVLPALVLLAGGAIVLRRRFALADWLYRPEPSMAGKGDEREADAAVAAVEPIREQARALELCALCVATLGIWTIVLTVGDLSRVLRELGRHPGPIVPLVAPLLFLVFQSALVLRRQAIANWILGRRSAGSEGEAARFQTAGLALFGLFLVLWYLPHIAAVVVTALETANPLRTLAAYARQYLLEPLIGSALGLALFLGKPGVLRVWRALRSPSATESDEQGPTSSPPA